MVHDLLTEPIFTVRDRKGRRSKTTLPGLLAGLAAGRIGDFPRLRTHQQTPWYMFLEQLAATALRRKGTTILPESEDEWRRFLLTLTDGQHGPWCLINDDLSEAAFLQPPVPEGTIAKWSVSERPDDIDMLVTSKNHDVKAGTMRGDELETWVYAFVTLQTMQGYPGRGYNRVSRMKGGYGSRPCVGVTADHTLSTRFRRYVGVLLATWTLLLARGYDDDGLALVWLAPWDGQTSLAMSALAPHFIEICWRIRFEAHGPHLRCRYTTTKARRCLPEIEGGNVGDPWIPVSRADDGALTVGSSGFHYRLVTRLLFEGDYAPAAAQRVLATDGAEPLFVASALARGQGKTEGLHERIVPLAAKARAQMGQPEGMAALGRRAEDRVGLAAKMRSKVLFPALKQLALGGTPMDDDFDARVDELFFGHLFDTLDLPDEEARLTYERALMALARREFERAVGRVGLADARRFKAISDAERMLQSCLRKHFPDMFNGSPVPEGVSA